MQRMTAIFAIAVGLLVLVVFLAPGIRRKLLEIDPLQELIIAAVATGLVGVLMEIVKGPKTAAKLVAALAIGLLVAIFRRFRRLEVAVRTTLRYEVRDNLVRTNALIPYDKKLAVTAQVVDFPPETEYAMLVGARDSTETIDVIRQFEYQNYFFTPMYLNFLFYRLAHARESHKIIIISEPSQAALVFVNLCGRIGYRTSIMSSTRFREFVELHCRFRPDWKLRAMIKGNPSLAKVARDDNGVTFKGKYTDRKRARGMGLGEHVPCESQASWDLLVRLAGAGRDVTAAVQDGRLTDVDTLRVMLRENEGDRLPEVVDPNQKGRWRFADVLRGLLQNSA